jgi:hypothetical protein
MCTIAIGQRGLASPRGWVSKKAVRLAALLGTLVVISVTLNALIIAADSDFRRQSPAGGNCAVITKEAGWPACRS